LTKVQALALVQSGVTGLVAMGLLLGYSCSGSWELNAPIEPDSLVIPDTVIVVPDSVIVTDTLYIDEPEPDQEVKAPTGGSITPLA